VVQEFQTFEVQSEFAVIQNQQLAIGKVADFNFLDQGPDVYSSAGIPKLNKLH